MAADNWFAKRATILLVLAFLLIAAWFFGRVVYPAGRTLTYGFAAYYTAARLLATGQISAEVYDPAYFRPLTRADSQQQADDIYNANPPTMSLLLGPLGLLPIPQARAVWTWLNALLLFAGLYLLTYTYTPSQTAKAITTNPNDHTLPPVRSNPFRGFLLLVRSNPFKGFLFLVRSNPFRGFLLLSILAMLFQPVLANLHFGQAYILLFFLLTITTTAYTPHASPPTPHASRITHHAPPSTLHASRLTLPLALVLKTAGWSLLPLLIWQRKWRTLLWIIGVSAGIILLTLPLFPLSMWLRYLALLRETTNSPYICSTAYQTTRSLLCQLFALRQPISPTPLVNAPWLASLLFAALALLTMAAIFRLSQSNSTPAFLAAITWGVLFSPLGEQHHHTLILIPLAWLLVETLNGNRLGWPGRIALLAAILLYTIPLPKADLHGWQALPLYPRLYAAWLILLTLYTAATPIKT